MDEKMIRVYKEDILYDLQCVLSLPDVELFAPRYNRAVNLFKHQSQFEANIFLSVELTDGKAVSELALTAEMSRTTIFMEPDSLLVTRGCTFYR
jgi:hypothetical protein